MGHSFKCISKSTLFFIAAILFLWMGRPVISQAQSTLTPGNIVLVTVNSDSPDNFDFVPLVSLKEGTVINFTDDAWIKSSSQFRGGEGIITYTATSTIAAGTVVSYSGADGNGFKQISGDFNTSGSGDNILVYQGSKTSPSFLYGVGFAKGSTVWTYKENNGTNTSDIPSALSFTDHTIISLGTSNNYQYDISNGTKGTKNSLLNSVGDESNWDANDGSAFPALEATFMLFPPPAVQFSVATDTVAEDAGSYTLTVKLAESNKTAISVDVVFLGSSSSANDSDIGNYSTQSVTFGSSAASGDTKKVTVNIADNSDFNGLKTAVFQLQNKSTGSIIDPGVLNLSISDDETPPVVINEILADPPKGEVGDANGDGNRSGTDDEFIEFVNTSSSAVDISGWQVSDNGTDIKYTFPSGTVLPGNGAAIVFGGGNPQGNFGGAIVQTAKGLSLNNSGDNPTLLNDDGTVIQSVSYGKSGEPQGNNQESLTRSPDVTGKFVGHTTADSVDHSAFSPGEKIDGKAFGSKYAIGIRGHEGWRFVATPTQGTSFSDLFKNLWTQGVPGSDAPSATDANLYRWHETGGGAFSTIDGMNNSLTPGKGYIIYVYEDNDFKTPGVQGGFPKVVSINKKENDAVNVAVSANDDGGESGIDGNEGYNLLGNPYDTDISVTSVFNALAKVSGASRNDLNGNVYIWNPDAGSGNGDYEILADGSGATIAPFQAFFIRYKKAGITGNASFNRSDLEASKGTQFYGRAGQDKPINHLKMFLSDGNKFDTYQLDFEKDGTVGEDRLDAYKLFSLNEHAISLFSTVGEGVKLAKNVIPAISSIDRKLNIPLTYNAPHSGKYTFSWSDLGEIPEQFHLYLVDNKTDQKIDMRTTKNFSFDVIVNEKTGEETTKRLVPYMSQTQEGVTDNSRFDILAVPSSSQDESAEQPLKEDVVVSPNYPNPFSSETSMNLQLKEKMHVRMTVYNIVGQKVATMVDKTMDAGGPYLMTWNVPGNMPSGIYICKIEAGNKVLTRKMTLVK